MTAPSYTPSLAEFDAVLARRSFRRFVEQVMPRYQWYRHCEALGDVLQRVAEGEIRRLMVFMPPRHGKSQEVSRLFTAYYLFRYPERWVAVSSYGADLAHTLSRAAREFYSTAGGPLSASSAAVSHWETGQGGGFWAAGVGGPCTGKGWNLGVIDDPVKNAEDAASEPLRLKQQEWYQSTFYTREEPQGGALIVIQTRWNERDLSGWLLEEEHGAEYPERWHVVNLAALRESDPELPPTCSLEPDWREEGEALCPERYDQQKLAKIRERLGSYYWSSLFMQRPSPRAGGFFRREWFSLVDAVPAE